jgi:hypothetical protein
MHSTDRKAPLQYQGKNTKCNRQPSQRRLLDLGNTQLVHERLLLENRIFPVPLHLCDIPICGVVPGGVAVRMSISVRVYII